MKEVYLAAWQLKIERVVSECARHLIEELSSDSCIEIRSLPGISKNKTFVTAVDDFISKEVRMNIHLNCVFHLQDQSLNIEIHM